MLTLDQFGRWIAKPENCNKVRFVLFGAFAAVWWLTGEWSLLP